MVLQITGLASTETVQYKDLVVTGITTLGVVTDTTSIQVTDLYVSNITVMEQELPLFHFHE